MNPEQSLREAAIIVEDCETVLEELLEAHKVAVTNQKQLIKVARATRNAWQEIVDKAKSLTNEK